MKGQHQKTIRTLLSSVREYKKASLWCPVFVVLEVLMEVLVPGVIGPAIGAAVLKNAELVVNGDGTTSFLPNANIWLAAFAAGVVLCGLLALLFARLKKDAPARKTA